MKLRATGLLLTGLLIGVTLAIVTPASAAEPEPAITSYSAMPGTTQAGGHPDVKLHVSVATSEYFVSTVCEHDECVSPRVLTNHFPEGFIGNPHVAPKCSLADFANRSCPVDSQIGILQALSGNGEFRFVPLYNMETNAEQAGLVAALAPLIGAPILLELSGRTDSDYGLDSISSPILRGFPIVSLDLQLWGVPADPVHNPHRFNLGVASCRVLQPLDELELNPENGCPASAITKGTFAAPGIPPAPFLQNPTTCDTALSSLLDLEYYGGAVVHAESPWPKMTGCQQLTFNPSQVIKPTTTRADTASGIDVSLKAPLPQSATGASPSEIRTNRVTLPEGISINPGAADGKLACADPETSIGTLFAASCPEFSKVGTTEIDNAALPAPIFGGLYLGEPKPGQPYRLILTADGFATHAKLTATVHADPRTGQLVTTFEDIPQTPIQEVNLHFFGSERGLLATTEQCGTFPVESEFVPWDSELTTRHATSFLTIDSGPNGTPCPNGPRPFAPSPQVGSANNTAGAHSAFGLTVDRQDGDQNLTGLTVETPRGFTATLAGIPYCPEASIARLLDPSYAGRLEQASPACTAASQVGTAAAGAGPGTHPLYAPGKVYLAGPYRGSPLSLVVVVPAVSGPYDFGNVVVRAAIKVDPETAQVTAISDPLPQILEGIPLRTRYIQVKLDRPNFTLNPTNCDPSAVAITAAGDEGASVDSAPRYQVANCDQLDYRPRLALTLSGGLKRRGHPAIRAVLRALPGEANTSAVSVTLPKGLLLDNSHLNTICTKVDFAKGTCPSGSRIGQVEARTPLLASPLQGSVYLRSSSHDLPDMVLDLRGQIDVVAVARIDSIAARLRATFQTVPDVPLGTVVLSLAGGRKGLLQNSESLCGADKRATVRMTGQNGAVLNTRTRLRASCRPPRDARRRHVHHRLGKAGAPR